MSTDEVVEELRDIHRFFRESGYMRCGRSGETMRMMARRIDEAIKKLGGQPCEPFYGPVVVGKQQQGSQTLSIPESISGAYRQAVVIVPVHRQ